MQPQAGPALQQVLRDLVGRNPRRRKLATAWYLLAIERGRHVPSESELRALGPYLGPVLDDPAFPRRPAGRLAALVAWAEIDADLLLGHLRTVEAARRLHRAIQLSSAAVDLAPDEALPALARAATLVAQGRPDDARALLSLAPDALGSRPVGLAVRAFAELRAGRPDRARLVLARAEATRADVELLRQARQAADG